MFTLSVNSRTIRQFRCNGGVALCLIWVTLSILVMVSNTILLMNYYNRGKHRGVRRRTIFVAQGMQDNRFFSFGPTSITEKFAIQLSKLFKTRYNDTDKPMTFEEFHQNVTAIKDYSYDQLGCRSIYENVSPEHKTRLITKMKCANDYTMIVLVSSNISHFDRRTLIRHTWGNNRYSSEGDKWKVFFLVGTTKDETVMRKLSCEAEMFKDIILGDTVEGFFNLTYKVQMGFEWSLKYCNYKFLIKADDDVFVNIDTAFNFLRDGEVPKTTLYAGNVNYDSPVVRKGKYAVTKKEYWKKIYPRYCSGGGFILSRDVVHLMALRIDNSKVPLKIDDAYVGILALANGIDTLHYDNFRMYEKEDKCLYNSTFIVHHPVKTRPCMFKLFAHHLVATDAVRRLWK